VKLFWRLLGEIRAGTIEQVYLSPLPSWLVAAAGRVLAALIETLILIGVTYGLVSAFVTLVWMAVTAAAYLTAGLVVFRVLERITRTRGTLAAY
jgi:ABC-2 type transport system permease protein